MGRYFVARGKSVDGGLSVIGKTAILFAWLVVSLVVFLAAGGFWLALACGVSAGLAMGGLGMAVQHDGGHRAFSKSPFVNQMAAAVLDLLGASSWIWRVKHGQLHHSYPNIVGADDDIELAPWLRLAPTQPRHWYHRWQHIYAFFLYAFFGLKWFVYDDFAQFVLRRIGPHPLRRPGGGQAVLFFGGKAAYLGWAIVLPVAFQGWVAGFAFLLASQFTMSVVLSVIFQLAHCVEEAAVVDPRERGMDLDFATHQLDATVDFGRGTRWLSWYCGGLNYQAVHHLFPRISHVHYPELSLVVEQTCAEFGVRYKVSSSLLASVRSHVRWMKRMGTGLDVTSAPLL